MIYNRTVSKKFLDLKNNFDSQNDMLYFTLRSNFPKFHYPLSFYMICIGGKQAFESEIINLYLILYLPFNSIGSLAISEVSLLN